jgi:hypothetical protein
MKITKDTKLEKILEIGRAREVLEKFNLPCLSCPFAKLEMENLKIGEICEMYGINTEKLLKELNESISE